MFQHTAIGILEDNITHIFYNDEYAIVFDPSDPLAVKKALSKKLQSQFYHYYEIEDLKTHRPRILLYSFTTHHHDDHSAGNTEINMICPKVYIGKSNSSDKNQNVFHTGKFGEETISIPEINLKVDCIHTPCHTLDSYCFLISSNEHSTTDNIDLESNTKNISFLVTGDTIFFMGVGMFFEGTGKDMRSNLLKLKNKVTNHSKTLILYGHDYRDRNIPFVETRKNVDNVIKNKLFLTFEEEMCWNPFFNLEQIYGESTDENMEKLRAEKTSFNSKSIN